MTYHAYIAGVVVFLFVLLTGEIYFHIRRMK